MDSNDIENSNYSFEHGNEICTHDGILLKKATAFFINDLNTSGCLSLVEYKTKRFFIEWQRNENILISDEGTQEQDDWSFVDTIEKTSRTLTENVAINGKCDQTQKVRSRLRVALRDLLFIEITEKGHNMRLISKADGSVQNSFLFQNGNADMFVNSMLHLGIIEKMKANRNVFEVLDESQSATAKLQRTFEELQIDEIKESGSWLTNIVRRNIDFLAKVSEYVPHQAHSSNTSPVLHLKNDDYELLNREKCETETEKDPNAIKDEDDKSDTKIMSQNNLPERIITERGPTLTEKQWHEFHTEDGRILEDSKVKEIIFRGGIEPGIRAELWKYLLNYRKWDETTLDWLRRCDRMTSEYYRMKAQWLSITVTQERNFSGYRDRKCQIEKDVKRTDRSQEFFAGENNPNLGLLQDILMTYIMYNFDLGYVQGMSDLLAPILSTVQNEADSFWCFVGFMELVKTNFDIDQAGMKEQLHQLTQLLEFANPKLYHYFKEHGSENMYFCFRWLLVWFKREFDTNNTNVLWECIWTGLPCSNFHLFIALAVLDEEADTFIDNNYEFNEILKYVNELSMQINLKRTLEVATAIYNQIVSAECLTDEIRIIIGQEPINKSQSNKYINDANEELDDLDVSHIDEPTPEDIEEKRRKLDEACENSMSYSFL